MFTLNIILLIASVALMVVGLALTWKPNPVYYFNEKTGKTGKLPKEYSLILLIFVIPGILFYFLSIMGVEFRTNSIVYMSYATSLFLASAIQNYRANLRKKKTFKIENSQKKKFDPKDIIIVISVIAVGAFIKNLLVVGIMIASVIIEMLINLYFLHKKQKTFSVYLILTFRLLLITVFLFLHIIEVDEIATYLLYASTIMIFLIQFTFFMYVLELKKHSPKYKKQYLEENSLQTDGSNTL